ncbi:hypothetical protein, partial [Pseudomonas viridiflava]|uniref:hypothetical protein n=1 Tax=Pseudomonas viridiflava TaxID=33069 RepID=UPI00197F1DE1
ASDRFQEPIVKGPMNQQFAMASTPPDKLVLSARPSVGLRRGREGSLHFGVCRELPNEPGKIMSRTLRGKGA